MAKERRTKRILPVVVVDEFNASTPDKLKEFIVESLNKVAAIKKQRKEDAQLNQLKSDVADLNKGYGGAIKYEEAKIDLARELLGDK